MSNIRLAKRYASGLWDYALSAKEESTIVQEMQSLIEIIEQNRDFQLFLKSPIIETSKKIRIANEISKSFSATTQHFITLVLRHKREIELLGIAKQVLALNDNYKGIQRVSIVSAVPLDKEMISKIIKSEPKINQEKAIIENKTDESLIGGYILRLEDNQIDASVKTKLNNIKKKLEEKVF
ncbi:MAG: ATP synthase F1 subunit delta [Flavobacteriaceae bacterium]|jgi:F-type H+-transporting ATPase subunit delta|nr:ATP synthase F1 subunit delta [Flavobacteriaceae bacterium]